jgi:peptide deformylase
MELNLVTIKSENQKILRQKTPDFDFIKTSPAEIKETVSLMRRIMKANQGVGLSANQVGLSWRMFIADYRNKFYVIFNPKITKPSKEKIVIEEGCLSVPDTFIDIERPESIVLQAQDKKGKKIKIKAYGVLARIFQHETDHLNGKLITDYLP